MGRRSWTVEAVVTVRGPVEAVAGWWSSEARQDEFRSSPAPGAHDVEWQEDDGAGGDGTAARRTLGRWVGPGGVRVEMTLTAPPTSLEGGVLVRRRTLVQRLTQPGGRVTTIESETVHRFVDAGGGVTRVEYGHTWTMTGGRWWEQHLPPFAQRAGERDVLRAQAARCQQDLAAGLPPD